MLEFDSNMIPGERLGASFNNFDNNVLSQIQRLIDNTRWIPIPEPRRLFGRTNLVAGGMDLCSIPAMEEMMGDDFLTRVNEGRINPELAAIFAPSEMMHALVYHEQRPAESLAGDFAVKEAGFKAGGFNYRDLRVAHRGDGFPYIILEERGIERATRLGVEVCLFGISHEDDMAAAWVVLLESNANENIDIHR